MSPVWYNDFIEKVKDGTVEKESEDYSAWEVPLDFLKEQVDKCEKEHMSFVIRDKDSGNILDHEKYELFIEGRNPDNNNEVSCAEDFPPIRWP